MSPLFWNLTMSGLTEGSWMVLIYSGPLYFYSTVLWSSVLWLHSSFSPSCNLAPQNSSWQTLTPGDSSSTPWNSSWQTLALWNSSSQVPQSILLFGSSEFFLTNSGSLEFILNSLEFFLINSGSVEFSLANPSVCPQLYWSSGPSACF